MGVVLGQNGMKQTPNPSTPPFNLHVGLAPPTSRFTLKVYQKLSTHVYGARMEALDSRSYDRTSVWIHNRSLVMLWGD